MRYLSIKNFAKHQHYKDRNPPWIKLHAALLDDYDFIQLPDAAKAHLMLLWILASKMDNRIPYDLTFITQRTGALSAIDIEELILRGFLEPYTEAGARGKREEWPSRHVSAQVRAALLSAAQHRCSLCPATEHLEIDHIVPISRGGTGEVSNLQVLCRQCNRRKRAKLQHDSAQPPRSKLLRSAQHSALLETETETEGETDKGGADAPRVSIVPRGARSYPPEFESAWDALPPREGSNSKAECYSAWRARRKSGVPADVLFEGAVRYKAYCDAMGTTGTQYVKQGKSFYGTGEHYLSAWVADKPKPKTIMVIKDGWYTDVPA